ncbi:hypothetical protein HK104_004859 [Borealophlyctis nickersoniae]|nr:hypothetical protein HK104_004859 [Borealophlyctis nickersoniae]
MPALLVVCPTPVMLWDAKLTMLAFLPRGGPPVGAAEFVEAKEFPATIDVGAFEGTEEAAESDGSGDVLFMLFRILGSGLREVVVMQKVGGVKKEQDVRTKDKGIPRIVMDTPPAPHRSCRMPPTTAKAASKPETPKQKTLSKATKTKTASRPPAPKQKTTAEWAAQRLEAAMMARLGLSDSSMLGLGKKRKRAGDAEVPKSRKTKREREEEAGGFDDEEEEGEAVGICIVKVDMLIGVLLYRIEQQSIREDDLKRLK